MNIFRPRPTLGCNKSSYAANRSILYHSIAVFIYNSCMDITEHILEYAWCLYYIDHGLRKYLFYVVNLVDDR